ncbi:hypothetical protein Dsin_012435 [Dipteronia sinensis]|uniref:Reverse transcriptase domain-containing protein n=1 Tax=Dipteronia sinensis TaxID=43782 RepID=A0AAE0AIR2_9ROSI|nr:hypothetical protein Dsin_012435 [Dipteronia sinensis]
MSGKRCQMALKLDMSKAYDRVEWTFLKAVMEKLNFPPAWISLIMDYISSSNLAFLLNGQAVCSVTPSKGLRQGCLLSPYLFLLCVEAFSCLVSSLERGGRVLRTRSARGGPLISHLLFTDDSILFSKASSISRLHIQKILGIYERASGQQINLRKSKITFSPNVEESARQVIQHLFGINDCNSQDSYLSLPSMVGRNKRFLFNDIKERVWKKMRGWKDSFFSFFGKEVLIKAVVQAIPTYPMSIFKLPVSLCKELSAMASKFWWGSKNGNRKISWVSWEKKSAFPSAMVVWGLKTSSLQSCASGKTSV